MINGLRGRVESPGSMAFFSRFLAKLNGVLKRCDQSPSYHVCPGTRYRRIAALSSLVAGLFLNLVASSVCHAQNPLTSEMLKKRAKLAEVLSYEAAGTATVTSSDELMAAVLKLNKDGDKDQTKMFRFHIWQKGSSTKEEWERIDSSGRFVDSETCYDTASQVVTDSNPGHLVSVSKVNPKLGIRDINPVFMEYCFLDGRAHINGIRSFASLDLETDEALRRHSSNPKGVNVAGNNLDMQIQNRHFRITFGKGDHEGNLYPERVEVFGRDGNALTVEVRATTVYPLIGRGAEELRMTARTQDTPAHPAMLLATWDYKITMLRLNPEIDDSLFTFDFSTAKSIWDSDKQDWIEIHK